jgi:hypothetical protein
MVFHAQLSCGISSSKRKRGRLRFAGEIVRTISVAANTGRKVRPDVPNGIYAAAITASKAAFLGRPVITVVPNIG